jgi:acyl-CoA synthetase (AMP-forming)/AMP-acid ligase II
MSIEHPPLTVADLIRRQASRFGDKPLIKLGARAVGYREANDRSAILARGMLAMGVGKGTRVGILMPNGPDWTLCWLAIARIGALAVPLNTFYKPRELGWALRHADVHLLLTADRFLSNDYLERLETFAPELLAQTHTPLQVQSLPYLRHVLVWGETARPWASAGPRTLEAAGRRVDSRLFDAVEASVSPADAMVVIYSSGSTADPKGAVHTQGAALRHAATLNRFRGLEADDRIYSPMPFFWVGGLIFVLISAIHAGATVLAEDAFEPGATLAYIERERATVVAGWPHYGKAMAEHPSFKQRDLSSIRTGNIYEILPPAARPADPTLRPNSLGMTETCGPHTIDDMRRDLPEQLRGSFGRSVPGLEHKVIDPTTGERLGAGGSGEICVRGYSVMQGLYKVEREAAFDDEGFYHTGDRGHFDDAGNLFFEGRLGDLIKTAGANVSPREVELALETIEGVKEAYVVGIPDPDRGQKVVAAVVVRADAVLTKEQIFAAVAKDLSAYKVPREILLYDRSALPFTDTGKIDKRSLQALVAARLTRSD